MIKNARQYKITKAWVSDFEEAQAELEARGDDGVHPVLRKAQIDAIRSEVRELKRQLEEYDALRQGKLKVLELNSFEDLPRGLIQARIAAGLSQRELAERLGLKEQQIQHYESTDYASASIRRVQEIIHALGVQVREEIRLSVAGATEALLPDGRASTTHPYTGIDSADEHWCMARGRMPCAPTS